MTNIPSQGTTSPLAPRPTLSRNRMLAPAPAARQQMSSPSVTALTQHTERSHYVTGDDLSQRLKSLEAEVASFRRQQPVTEPEAMFVTQQASPTCNHCGTNGCMGNCGVHHGIYAGADLVIAKPYFGPGYQAGDASFDYHASPRLIAGFHNGEGTGIRARYWWYDGKSKVADGSGSSQGGTQTQLRMNVLDLELIRDLDWGLVSASMLGGFRYAEMDHFQIAGGSNRTAVDGWGPTFGLESATLIFHNTDLVANLRYSALFGNGKATSVTQSGLSSVAFGMLESQFGVRYRYDCGLGTVGFSGLFEAQQWFNVGRTTNVGSRPDDDVLVLGVLLGIDLTR